MEFLKNHNKGILGVGVYLLLLFGLLLFSGMSKPSPIPSEEGVLMDFSKKEMPSASVSSSLKPDASDRGKHSAPDKSLLSKETDGDPDVNTNPTVNDSDLETQNDLPEEIPKFADLINFEKGSEMVKVDEKEMTGIKTDGDTDDGLSPDESGEDWTLIGRINLYFPNEVVSDCEGKVLVTILVNREGVVTSAEARPGATVDNAICIQKAEEMAMQALFNKDSGAKKNQRGEICIRFIAG